MHRLKLGPLRARELVDLAWWVSLFWFKFLYRVGYFLIEYYILIYFLIEIFKSSLKCTRLVYKQDQIGAEIKRSVNDDFCRNLNKIDLNCSIRQNHCHSRGALIRYLISLKKCQFEIKNVSKSISVRLADSKDLNCLTRTSLVWLAACSVSKFASKFKQFLIALYWNLKTYERHCKGFPPCISWNNQESFCSAHSVTEQALRCQL